jgi:DNA-directed RNA polymerase sigma subunit (sigma70/sigma32)
VGDAEAVALVAQAQAGDRGARAALTIAHRRLVVRVAERYARSGLSWEERTRLGEQGLGVAVEKFTPAKGFSFSTYATWWIRRTITGGLGGGDATSVREPRAPRPSSGAASAGL